MRPRWPWGNDLAVGDRVRVGWLAITLALAGALVISSWSNYRTARSAVQTLYLGQAEIHSAALRSLDSRSPFDGTAAVLDSVLVTQSEAGLRYIALLDADGSVEASVGESLGPVELPSVLRPGVRLTSPVLQEYDDRVRAFFGRGPDRTVVLNGGNRRGAGVQLPRDRADSAFVRRILGPPPQQYLLLEFEPIPASEVVSQAVSGLFLNGLGAALLTLVSLGFWRVSRGYEAAQKQMEQQKRLSQLGEMSAVLAHEIRNPLASLKGNAQLLAEGLAEDPARKRKADRVVGEAVRLEALTTDLLDFARSAPLLRVDASPAEVLRVAVEEVAPGQVETDLAGSPTVWPLDQEKIRQVLVNLLRNACQVSPPGKHPVAAVSTENQCLRFSIRDFGPGVPTEDRERIFEPFYTTRTQGTGLGLAVAKRVIEMHGGRLTVQNHTEGGAVFTADIPPLEN